MIYMESKRRIKIVLKNPNPLFRKWLQEWIEDAEKQKKKISLTYQKALDSLNKYPLTLYSGHDCAILENIGPKICQMLDEKLEKNLSERLDLYQQISFKDKISEVQQRESLKVSEIIKNIEAAFLTDESFAQATLINIDEDIEMQEHISQLEISSLYTNSIQAKANDVEILEELLSSSAESDKDSFDELVRKHDPVAVRKCEKTRTKFNEDFMDAIIHLSHSPPPLPSQIINSPISTGVGRGRKLRKFNTFDTSKNHLIAGPSFASSPISGFLNIETSNMSPITGNTSDSNDEFDKLVAKYNFISRIPAASSKIPPTKLANKSSNSKLKTIEEKNPTAAIGCFVTQPLVDDEDDKIKYICIDDINPMDFNVVLLVDTQEISGKSKTVSDEIIVNLRKSNVTSEVRKLNVGDFLWIAQHKIDKSNELVLPYIIERKRLDDLSSSIKDGRFHEQKFRLKQCGVQNAIYLIENHMKGGKIQTGLPLSTLLQAATNTQIHSNFQVKFTENSQHTILYLTVITSFIENIFKNKGPVKFQMIEFKMFNQAAVKQKRCTVRETFIKQILALKGLSVDIALEIIKTYPTPTDLYEKYLQLNESDGESLLSKITIGDLKRKIPAPVSKTIYQFYMRDQF